MSVSILLPFRNAAPWIKETVNSILAQTYASWELIAVDDFSTDDSLKIVERLAKTDSRIKIHQNTEKGIIPALQLAFSHAQGDFITRMDADDLMPKNRLEQMVDVISKLREKSIVTGKVKYFSNEEVSEGYKKYEAWLNDRISKEDHFNHLYRECVVASPNWMARRADFMTDKIIDLLNYPEDYDMTFQWFKCGYTINSIPEVTLLWREHPARTSRNSNVYDQTSFFRLKLNWFRELNDVENNSIGILGAGTKGKLVAEDLIAASVEFSWYDFNFEKYAAGVLNREILDYSELNTDLLLIAIYPEHLDQLITFIESKGFLIGRNAWFL